MRLIDADALLEGIAELKQSPWFNDKYGYAYRKDAVESIEYLCIKKEPTIDAVSKEKYEASVEARKILAEFADDLLAELKERVEVVRCKDCKHWCNEIDEHTYECCTRAIVNRFKPDDFCSYGERKEE